MFKNMTHCPHPFPLSLAPSLSRRILVGAPKGTNLQPGTNESGALFKCPLTTNTDDCVQVHTDGFRNPRTRRYEFDYLEDNSLSEPVEDEIKDGQWLGVTLKSQGPGGKVLVCAHRYMHKGPKFQWGYGLCYILTNNLDVMDNLEPCRGKPVNNGHQQYGFCQAGTSGLLLEDEVVLGVPGPFTWRGTVHTSNISDNFLFKDKTQYFGPVTETDYPVDKYSYLGYSVTAGRFFGNYMSYVGGAPRSRETGQVVFFTREKIGNSLLRVDLILDGEMFASSFGYEVLAIDINGDKRDDLVVGAPFYYSRVASGAIYVYMNNEGGFQENHPFTKIEGAPGESRFGSSMTSLGDLNRDGYLDVAVGAPYEGRGVIYIFLGSKDGLVTEPAQVIRAEDLPGTPYDAFGYSLSGGMDLDNNGYPDLLTSSFCSDRVLLLRARPIIDIETRVSSNGQLNNIDPSRKGCREDITANETCFSFDACFKMDNNAGTRTGLRLHYTIEERPYQDRPLARVRFADSAPNEPSEVHRNIVLRPEDMGLFLCSKEVVYLLEGSRDILRPLRFKLTYEIIQKDPTPVAEGDRMPDINEYPILNQKGALRYFEGTFAKECGDDELCESDLNVTASLDLEYNKIQKHHLLRLGEQDTVPLLVEVTNSKEPAYETSLLVTHDKALTFDQSDSKVGIYQCSSTGPGVVKCGVGNPLLNSTGTLNLTFRESGNIFDSRFIYFSVQANSSSTELTPQDPVHFRVEVIKRAEISIRGDVTPEQVFYGGEVVGESAIKHFDEIGMEVTHKYSVENGGPWRVDELQVEILWPYQVENGKAEGKWLLYMTEHPTVDGVGECEIDPSYINPLNLRRPRTEAQIHEVDLERETTDGVRPAPEEPTDTGAGVIVTGTKVTKTTITKKVTNSTVKKTTAKTSSEKKYSSSTSGSSSSSTGYSSSSSSSSSSGYDGHGDNVEGSGYDDGSRVHGRTHSRVSRRVFSSSDKSRFNENDLDGKTGEGEEDEDGRVITQYERTHHSSGTSPDGSTTFKETRRESKKVTVSENTNTEHIPSSRWGQGGGYRRTYTSSSSSSSSSDGEPEEARTRWETRRTYSAGQDGDDQLGGTDSSDRRTYTSSSSSSSSSDGEPEEARTRWETRRTYSAGQDGDDQLGGTDSSDRRTYTSSSSSSSSSDGEPEKARTRWETRRTYSAGQDGDDRLGGTDSSDTYGRREESSRQYSRTHTYGSSSGDTHSGGLGEDNYHRTHEGGAVTRTIGGDGSYLTESDRRTRTRVQEGANDRERFAWSDQTEGIPYDREHRGRSGEGHYNQESTHRSRTTESKSISGGEPYLDSDGDRYGSRRVESHDQWSQTRPTSSQGHDDDGFRRRQDYSSRGGHDDRYSSSQSYRSHNDGNTDEAARTYSSDHETARGWQSEDTHRGTSEGGKWRDRQQLDADSHSETRTSAWHSRSSSGHENGDEARASSHHFTHMESGDGTIQNGTYTRVEVDPETGETNTFTSKVVYNRWPTDHDLLMAQRDASYSTGEEHELSGDHQRSGRAKREKELIIKPQAVTDEKTGKTMQVVNLQCDGPATAKCFAFRCNIRHLGARRTASIHIKSRLWNATLVEDYPRVSYVSIKSKGSLILPDDIREDQSQEDDVDSAQTLAYPDLLDQLPPEEVPLWVILVSIFAGLLLLILIVLVLWKLGFFERRRPDPTLSGNLDKDANGY
ncbi:integrin alpha-PS1-like isoform X4 [Eriocheir sinensis]|uniref:integrin alpha-PS1-like isoform X4 n=1 Tax=Eriocheir sinensis TaxID=95602 RepID=UPI0021C9C284|nr:integrin alpha-PS1-like isoform X4 [Eriocheir sinensis]